MYFYRCMEIVVGFRDWLFKCLSIGVIGIWLIELFLYRRIENLGNLGDSVSIVIYKYTFL